MIYLTNRDSWDRKRAKTTDTGLSINQWMEIQVERFSLLRRLEFLGIINTVGNFGIVFVDQVNQGTGIRWKVMIRGKGVSIGGLA